MLILTKWNNVLGMFSSPIAHPKTKAPRRKLFEEKFKLRDANGSRVETRLCWQIFFFFRRHMTPGEYWNVRFMEVFASPTLVYCRRMPGAINLWVYLQQESLEKNSSKMLFLLFGWCKICPRNLISLWGISGFPIAKFLIQWSSSAIFLTKIIAQ